MGLGITPLLVTFASPVHINAILFREQILHITPNASFKILGSIILVFCLLEILGQIMND